MDKALARIEKPPVTGCASLLAYGGVGVAFRRQAVPGVVHRDRRSGRVWCKRWRGALAGRRNATQTQRLAIEKRRAMPMAQRLARQWRDGDSSSEASWNPAIDPYCQPSRLMVSINWRSRPRF